MINIINWSNNNPGLVTLIGIVVAVLIAIAGWLLTKKRVKKSSNAKGRKSLNIKMKNFAVNIGKNNVVGDSAISNRVKASNSQSNLTTEEKKIIKLAKNNRGEIYRFSVEQVSSDWIRIGKKDFLFEDDIPETVLYLEALELLEDEGFVKREGKNLYRLTTKGWKYNG